MALHRGVPESWTAAGFGLHPEAVRGAEITPASGAPRPGLPPAMQRYHALVGEINWNEFACAGGIDVTELTPYATHLAESRKGRVDGGAIDPSETFVFGWSPCGAMLIYTSDGRGGWATFDGAVHILGTIEETLNWVFAELLADRCPDFDYGWIKHSA